MNHQTNISTEDSISELKKEIKEPKFVVNYRLDSLANAVEIDSFQAKFNKAQKDIIFAINRIDGGRLRPGAKLVIPDTLVKDLLKYAPFPEIFEILAPIPKVLLISQRIQGFALYENGMLIKWGPVSSGKKSTPTPNGLHYANYKSLRKISTVNQAWIMPYYFNFMNFYGVGLHEYDLPGYPASHACVRLYKEDAQFIYDWAEQWKLDKSGQTIHKNGTPFMVFGEYDYKNPYPWINLVTDHFDNNLTEIELNTLKQYVEQFQGNKKNFLLNDEDLENDLVSQ